MAFDANTIRGQFPALSSNDIDGIRPVFFDNPAGTQVPQAVIDAVADYYTHRNANSGGTFATSQRSDQMVQTVRQRVKDFIHAANPNEICFGPNMTTLNFSLSRALAKTLKPGDEIVLTRMDHDANVSPWLLIAQDHDLIVKYVDIIEDDCTLDMASLEAVLTDRTRIVATVHASNAVGTINPVQQIAQMAHAAGAYHVIDAVQSAPHVPIDVQAIDCDFLLFSMYKVFGPHIGILWGKYDLLAQLPVYKVRPAKDAPPHRWESGTQSFETIAGVGAALEYIATIGREQGAEYAAEFSSYEDWGLDFKTGMAAIRTYETALITELINVLLRHPKIKIYGITDPARMGQRVPTVVFVMEGYTAKQVAEHLAQHHIYVWSGDYYAVEIMTRLGHAEDGMLRVGMAHYNTFEEIERLETALQAL